MEARTAVGNYDAQSGRYFLHAGSGGVVRQKGELAVILGVQARAGAGGRARHRRQFRHQELALPGICAGAVGLEARRAAGEMDLRAQRSVPQRLPGPRSRRQGRACARPARQIPRHARLASQQHRRLCRLDRAAAQGREHLLGRLSRAGRALPRLRGAHQHHADDPLSQRRAPGGDVHHGAAVRSRRAQDRHRPHRDQAAQSDRARASCPTARRSASPTTTATTKCRWTRASRSPTGRSSASAAPNRRSAASCAASGSRTTSS